VVVSNYKLLPDLGRKVPREFGPTTIEETIFQRLKKGHKILTAISILFRESFISSGRDVQMPQPAKYDAGK